MKNRLLLVLTVLGNCCVLCVQGQETFEKYYEGLGTGKLNLLELTNGNLFVGIAQADFAWQTGTSLLDPQGNLLHSRLYKVDTMLVVQSVKKVSDNEFYFGTSYVEGLTAPDPGAHPLFGKMDSLSYISTLRYYHLNVGTSVGNGIGDLEVISNKGVIGWDRDNRLFMMKADSNLMHVWSRAFDQEGVFHFVKELPGGDLLAGFDLAGTGASMMRLDADGNILWCKRYFQPGSHMHDAVIESDSAFVTAGYAEQSGQHAFMMKVNGDGEVLWNKGYSTTLPWNILWTTRVRIANTLDGNQVLLLNTGTQLSNGRAWLLKTDMNGDTLWVRRYGVNGVGYETIDLLCTGDGGYMFDGLGYPWGTFLFKTDSMGHLPCSEAAPAPLYITELFPVDSNLTLTSVDGAMTMPAYAQDTTYDAITTYDGCAITSIQGPVRTRFVKPRIRPNPNTGRFTVEFTDPLAVDSFYSVYDAVGKLLFQRPLAKGRESEEIDLSRFGAGTYLIRITSKDGVCNERVVVQ